MFSHSTPFNPDKDIPDLSSKTIIVTGGNIGLGKETILQLSKHNPSKLYLAARSRAKFDTAMKDILKVNPSAETSVSFLELDLASFASIKRAADTVLTSSPRLDLLINNAGVMALPPGLTEDGYEIQFGTNHMGHALLTKLLMPLLLKTANEPGLDVRIINLTSAGEGLAPKGGFLPEKATTKMESHHSYVRYGHSKLANVLFTKELAKRYPNITSVSIHPGRVQTNLLNHFFENLTFTSVFQKMYDFFDSVSVEKGVYNQLWAAVADKDKVKNGEYYAPVGKGGGQSAAGKDMALAEKLWEWQEAEFAKKGY
jgi:NAD(P)-dependent dehydrogenase (short-subunit alcohol dehydrogenase family)